MRVAGARSTKRPVNEVSTLVLLAFHSPAADVMMTEQWPPAGQRWRPQVGNGGVTLPDLVCNPGRQHGKETNFCLTGPTYFVFSLL